MSKVKIQAKRGFQDLLIKLLSATGAFLSTVTVAIAQTPKPLLQPDGNFVNPNIEVQSIPQLIVGWVFALGMVLAVLYLMWGGIRWITSRGDKQAVADARKQIIAALVGVVVIAGTFFILNTVFKILNVDNPLSKGFEFLTLPDPSPGT